MALLNSILQYKPHTWDDRHYTNVRYARVTLSKESIEFKEIETEFLQEFGGNQTVLEIERIQHPFAYGRYQIRKQHLQKLHSTTPSVN